MQFEGLFGIFFRKIGLWVLAPRQGFLGIMWVPQSASLVAGVLAPGVASFPGVVVQCPCILWSLFALHYVGLHLLLL